MIRHRVAQPSLEMDTCTGKHDFVYRKRTSYVGRWMVDVRTGVDGKVADLEKHTPASVRACERSLGDAGLELASSDAVEDTLASYKQRFKERYGINILDSQNRRVLRPVVEKQLNIRSGAFLDLGIGTRGNTASLASMNGCDTWTPYGVLPEAIEQCKARFSHEPDEFAAF